MKRNFWQVGLICLLLLALVACDELLEEEGDDTAYPPPISNTQSGADDVGDIRIEEVAISRSGTATVELNEGDASFLFVATAADPEDQLYVDKITAPDGTLLYELHDYDNDEFTSEMFTETIYDNGELILYLPVAPQFGELEAGEYKIKLGSVSGEEVQEAHVVIRSGPITGWQAVDINLFVVSKDEVVADSDNWADLEDNVRAAVDNVLNQQEMMLGYVNIVLAPNKIIKKYAELDDSAQEEVCVEMANEVGLERAWNIVLVDELLDEEGDPYFGLSPLAGSTLLPADNSCVIVAWGIHENDFTELGGTIVHEASHFASLQHTTEENGTQFDIFTDTPECSLRRYDENEDDSIDDEECGARGGASNYMFPTDSALEELLMSEDQGWVLRRHPSFYPVEP